MNRDFEKLIITMLIAAGTLAAPALVSLAVGASLHPVDIGNLVIALLSVRLTLIAVEIRARS